MNSLFHAVQIGTLSTWLSLTSFGLVGVTLHPWHPFPKTSLAIKETVEVTINEFSLETPQGSTSYDPADSAEETPSEPQVTEQSPTLPPELAPLSDLPPLPEVPKLSAPSPNAIASPRQRQITPSTTSTSPRSTGKSVPAASGNGASGDTSAMAESRLSAGRMPAPKYPANSKRNKETGTIIVEFTIGTDGHVMSAYAKSPSPWPALNEAAVSTVRTWKFPPGGILKTERPITFKIR